VQQGSVHVRRSEGGTLRPCCTRFRKGSRIRSRGFTQRGGTPRALPSKRPGLPRPLKRGSVGGSARARVGLVAAARPCQRRSSRGHASHAFRDGAVWLGIGTFPGGLQRRTATSSASHEKVRALDTLKPRSNLEHDGLARRRPSRRSGRNTDGYDYSICRKKRIARDEFN